MTDRHLAALSLLTHGAASGGEHCSSYFDQHLTNATAPTTTPRQSATLHYQAQQQQQHQALQQRLLYQQQQQQQQQQRYHAAAFQQHVEHSISSYAAHPYSGHYNHLPVRDSMAISNYLSHQQPMHAGHYDGTFHGRLIGSAAADMIAHNRARFLPYHSQKHAYHGGSMYTAAGHQLMPSSVLHYPPRTSVAYHALQQKQQQQQHQFNQGIYEQQLQQRAYLHNLNGTETSQTSGAYNPYSISQHHYQQSQLSLLSSQQQQQHQEQKQQQQSRCTTPAANPTNMPNHAPHALHTTELPTKTNLNVVAVASSAAAAANYEGTYSYGNINHNNSEALYQQQQQQQQQRQHQHQQQAQQQFRDCLTTSPPLISASGTDSGISSSSGCSTRGGTRGSDSTQSTPVYSGEYPMSVGSSSGVSYHYADSVREHELENRDIKDDPLVMIGNKDELTKSQRDKHELNEHENEFQCVVKKEPLDEGSVESKTDVCSQTSTIRTELNSFQNQYNNYANTSLTESAVINRRQMECSAPLSSTTSASGIQTNSSPINIDRCTTPFIQAPSSYASPQHQQQQQKQQTCSTNAYQNSYNNNNSWSPFPSSPNNWLHRSSPTYDNSNRDQESPLQVPVPPHNSPVDFEPSAGLPPLPLGAATAANSRSRTKDSDLKPVKKSRRKAVEIKVEPEEKLENNRFLTPQHITPLPGFQQAFGSTEIGRFSETFSVTPDCALEQYANCDENLQQLDFSIASGQNGEQYGSTAQVWNGANESYADYSDRGCMQYNMRYPGNSHNFGLGYGTAATQYGLRESMKLSRSNGNFNEIRCNGY